VHKKTGGNGRWNPKTTRETRSIKRLPLARSASSKLRPLLFIGLDIVLGTKKVLDETRKRAGPSRRSFLNSREEERELQHNDNNHGCRYVSDNRVKKTGAVQVLVLRLLDGFEAEEKGRQKMGRQRKGKPRPRPKLSDR